MEKEPKTVPGGRSGKQKTKTQKLKKSRTGGEKTNSVREKNSDRLFGERSVR